MRIDISYVSHGQYINVKYLNYLGYTVKIMFALIGKKNKGFGFLVLEKSMPFAAYCQNLVRLLFDFRILERNEEKEKKRLTCKEINI